MSKSKPLAYSAMNKNSNLMDLQQPNHEMLVLAREIRGITQAQLVKLTPTVTQGNLSRMEKGKLTISDNALAEISSALKFPRSFFFQKGVKTPISDFYYRKRVTVPKKKLAMLEAAMDLVRISLDSLFSDIELPPLKIPSLETSFGVSPEEAARKVRTTLNIPRGPVKNLINLFERNGVVVFLINSDTEKFDGITLFTDDSHAVMFLNGNLPNDRKRFTLAHELAHLTLHIRNPFDDRPDKIKEDEADRFASEFLMPELDIRNSLAGLTFGMLGNLKSYWQVSMRSLIYRAEHLRIISPVRAKNLYIELSRLGFVKNEPGLVDFDEPNIVKKAIQLLQTELGYTHEEIANDLALSDDDFKSIFLGIEQKIVQLKLRAHHTKDNDAKSEGGRVIDFFSH